MNQLLACLCLSASSALAGAPAKPVPQSPPSLRWTVGKGAPKTTIVFLHGLGGEPDSGLVHRLLKPLAKEGVRANIVAPWLRPVLMTEDGDIRSNGPHTMTDQLQRARAAIEAEPGPLFLMGHSFGGKAALELAKEYPGKVQGVIGLAPSVKMLYAYWKQLTGERGLPAREQVEARLAKEETSLLEGIDGLPHDDDRRYSLESALTELHFMRDLAANDEAGIESGIRTPTLVLHGTDDHSVSVHYAERLAEDNPGLRLVKYDHVDHGFYAHGVDDEGRTEAQTKRVTGDMAKQIAGFLRENAP